jgi:hypothetical protein
MVMVDGGHETEREKEKKGRPVLINSQKIMRYG